MKPCRCLMKDPNDTSSRLQTKLKPASRAAPCMMHVIADSLRELTVVEIRGNEGEYASDGAGVGACYCILRGSLEDARYRGHLTQRC